MYQLITIDDLPDTIIGAEDEPSGEANSTEGQPSTEGDPQDKTTDTSTDADTEDPAKGLKSALETERSERKALEKKVKAFEKAEADKALANKTEIEQAQIRADQATEKASRLAAGIARRDVESVVASIATTLNFIDTDDALRGVDIKSIPFEQDEDDPTQVTVDKKFAERLVKELASKKTHFIRTGTSDGEPTGGKFGGSKRGKEANSDDDLRQKYPALR